MSMDYKIFIDIYKDKNYLFFKDYETIWVKFNIGYKLAHEIVKKINIYLKDPRARKKIDKLYNKTLKSIKKKFLPKII